MTNDDLKRLYNINAKPQQKKDFARYDENGRLKAKAGVDDDDVATVGQLGGGTDNALTKPTTAPSTTQIVAVDTANTQKMLTIGDGLSIENDTLKASSGSGGEKLYMHNVIVYNSAMRMYLTIINRNNTIINTTDGVINFLYGLYGHSYQVTGDYSDDTYPNMIIIAANSIMNRLTILGSRNYIENNIIKSAGVSINLDVTSLTVDDYVIEI